METTQTFEASASFSKNLDLLDPLGSFRNQFHIPKNNNAQDCIYFLGNSLGLQPKKAKDYVLQELDDWAKYGIEGHFTKKNPWLTYYSLVTESSARVVGALPTEVVVMNALTVNLHLMMVSFYNPTKERHKILMETGAFPSDQYAAQSQIHFHGYDPKSSIIELKPREGEEFLRTEDILKTIDKHGNEIALILIGSVNYKTGQAYDLNAITQAGHKKGCKVGFDLAHGAGNVELKLHDWGPDFAVWCNYKYLNSGPGAPGGCFVHERHSKNFKLPRFSGWWGNRKESRFKMSANFDPFEGAEGWQISNPPVFQLAALRASLQLFDEATMSRLIKKRDLLTGYLEFLLERVRGCKIVTTSNRSQRGSQLSLRFQTDPHSLLDRLKVAGIICDFREPDIIRVAPVPMYNRFEEVYRFFETIQKWTHT